MPSDGHDALYYKKQVTSKYYELVLTKEKHKT